MVCAAGLHNVLLHESEGDLVPFCNQQKQVLKGKISLKDAKLLDESFESKKVENLELTP